MISVFTLLPVHSKTVFPAERRVGKNHEVRVEQRVPGIVAQAGKIGVSYPAPRFFNNALTCGAIPFRGRPEACVYVGNSFSHQTKFQRTADCNGFNVIAQIPEELLLLFVAVRAATGNDQGVGPAGPCTQSGARFAVALFISPLVFGRVITELCYRYVNYAENGVMILDSERYSQ